MARRLAGLWVAALVASAGPREATAAGALAASLSVPALAGAQVAALVVDADSGRTRFARDPDRALVPASNQKILTALAALATFGPAHRFTTEVRASAPPDGNGHVDALYVHGGGDPALRTEDFLRLAAVLRRGGLASVGRVVVDDGAFDGERWHPSWGPPSPRAYLAPIGALQANFGTYTLELRPGETAGDPVRVSIDPPVAYLSWASRAVTAPPGASDALQVDRARGDGAESILVTGRIAAGAPPVIVRSSVADPTAYAAAVLELALRANGVRVGSPAVGGAAPYGAPTLLEFAGPPLSEIVHALLKESVNPIAEALVKALASAKGAPLAGWRDGVVATREALARAGLDVRTLRMVDGSGLSPENRVSPRALVDALRIARGSFAFGPELVAALPIAGLDGTLRERAESVRGQVRAKTGRLQRIAALSGEARTRAGGVVVFSVLVNGHRSGDEEVTAALDGFLEALIADEGREPGRDGGGAGS